MTVLAITGDRNHRRSDFTGAFLPESNAFRKLHGGIVVRVNLASSAVAMRRTVLDAIANHRPSHVAIFCHGYTTGLQLGFRRVHAAELAKALASVRCERVTLYACSTGGGPGAGGDGGFADRLRDEMCKVGLVGCRVDAHDRAGHTTRLPYVRRFEGMDSPTGGAGGYYLVAPGSELWRSWVRALRDTDLRFRFPAMLTADVHRALAERSAVA